VDVLLPLLPLLLVPSALGPRAAWGYVQTMKQEEPVPIRWEGTNCIKVRAHAAGLSQMVDGSEFTAVRESVNHWQKAIASCSYLKLTVLEPSAFVTLGYSKTGENETAIMWVEKNWVRDSEHDKEALALTTVSYVDSPGEEWDGVIIDADIEINAEHFQFSTTDEAKKHDLQNCITHELGHVLGLDHPCYIEVAPSPLPSEHTGVKIPDCRAVLSKEVQQRTMFPSTEAGIQWMRSPEADDILGICRMYPTAKDPGTCGWVPGDGGCAFVPDEERALEGNATWTVLVALCLILLLQRKNVSGSCLTFLSTWRNYRC
jgi:hypothetical protein